MTALYVNVSYIYTLYTVHNDVFCGLYRAFENLLKIKYVILLKISTWLYKVKTVSPTVKDNKVYG
jgi:hypothetical protein